MNDAEFLVMIINFLTFGLLGGVAALTALLLGTLVISNVPSYHWENNEFSRKHDVIVAVTSAVIAALALTAFGLINRWAGGL